MDVDCSEFETGGYRYKRDTSDDNSTETTESPSTGSSETSLTPNTDTNTHNPTNIPSTNTINSAEKGAYNKLHLITFYLQWNSMTFDHTLLTIIM